MPSQNGGTNRPVIAAMFRGPGPAAVLLPNSTGYKSHDFTKNKAPAYSFGFKPKWKASENSPGPAYLIPEKLTRVGADGSPRYTLKGRTNLQTSFRTPGPDAYAAEKVPPLKEKKAPSYSFGLRTRYAQKDGNPAPNQYTLPNLTGGKVPNKYSSSAYSLTGRSKIGSFHEDMQKTPGPGTYKVTDPKIYKQKLPEYSMSARNHLPGDTTQKPGPGAYSPEKVYITKREMPKFSFGIRHSEYTAPVVFALD